jgi:hypothetical protein
MNTTGNNIPLNITGGAATSVAVSTQATHGTATASGTSITYSPTNGYSGSDSFQYTASNANGTSSPATATITVSAAAQPPVANTDNVTVPYNATNFAIYALNNDTDPYGYPLTIIGRTNPQFGTSNIAGGAYLQYTPNTGFSGSDQFSYTISDGHGQTAMGFAYIVVNPAPPIAGPVSTGVNQDSSNTNIPLNLSGGAAASVAVSTQASHGTATASGLTISYTPAAGYTGSDSFQYTATNVTATSAPGTVTLNVSPVNHAPTPQNDSISIYHLNPQHLNYCASGSVNVLTNDTDPDGDTLTVQSFTNGVRGTTTISGGTITYHYPCTNQPVTYTDTFTYTVSDGRGGTATATVTVTIEIDYSA